MPQKLPNNLKSQLDNLEPPSVMVKESRSKEKIASLPTGWWIAGLTSAIAIGLAGLGLWRLSQLASSPESSPQAAELASPAPTEPPAVTALGRLSPQGEVIKVSAASSSMEGSRIEELRVEEGDKVRAGQVIAVLDSRERLQAALEQADKEVKLKQAELAKVKAGAKSGEIVAQQAEVVRLEAQLEREFEGQSAKIARLEAQVQRDAEAGRANIARLRAQLRRETEAGSAKVARLTAQLQAEKISQKATVTRLQAELKNAESEYKRNRELYENGAISASEFDTRRLNFETAKERVNEGVAIQNRTLQTLEEQINEAEAALNQAVETGQQLINEAEANLNRTLETGREELNEAQAMLKQIRETGREQVNQATATLDKIVEIRPEDIQAAQADVERAIAAKEKAQAEFDLSYVKAPLDGQILKVVSRQGERVANEGIVELGRTQQMYVTAEVYETDVGRLRPGLRATITSPAFQGNLEGTVDRIGKQIGKKDVLNTDPAADTDARVVEVKIRLTPESSQKVTDFTNLQVEVKIIL